MKDPNIFLDEKIASVNKKLYAAFTLFVFTGLFFVPVPYHNVRLILNFFALSGFISSLLLTKSVLPERKKYLQLRKDGGCSVVDLELTDKYKFLKLTDDKGGTAKVQFDYFLVTSQGEWKLAADLTYIFNLAHPGGVVRASVLSGGSGREIIDIATEGLSEIDTHITDQPAITDKVASEGEITEVTKTGYILESYLQSKSTRYYFVINGNSTIEVDKDTFDSTPVYSVINSRPKISIFSDPVRSDIKKVGSGSKTSGYLPYNPKLIDRL